MDCNNLTWIQNSLPGLIVFDLDYTLWPLWVDTHVHLPVKKLPDGYAVDKNGYKIGLFENAEHILKAVKHKGIPMAVASRTGATNVAESLLDAMDLNKYFAAKEIYPGSKVSHFLKFKQALDVPYCRMLFFDDEERNVKDLAKLGVTAIHVPDGISWTNFKHGLKIFSENSTR